MRENSKLSNFSCTSNPFYSNYQIRSCVKVTGGLTRSLESPVLVKRLDVL
jgi:hypothetical protein